MLAAQQRLVRRRQRFLQHAAALAVGVLLVAGAGKAGLFAPLSPAQTVAIALPTAGAPNGPQVPQAFAALAGKAALPAPEKVAPQPVVPEVVAPARIRNAVAFDADAWAEKVGTVLEEGVASYYGDEFAGRPTANGEAFDPDAMTAAHPTLPLGSVIRVTNLRNGQSIVVRVNDRGPYSGDRVLDLSHGAARALKMARHGTARIRIEVL